MTEIDDDTLVGEVRAVVAVARYNDEPVDDWVQFALAVADVLHLPDHIPMGPAFEAAMKTPTRLDLPESIASTREIAIAAAQRKLS